MKDLSNVAGSSTNIIQSNSDKINNCKTVAELVNTLVDLFTENNLNTRATRRLLTNVKKSKNIGDAFITVYNSYLCGCDLAVK